MLVDNENQNSANSIIERIASGDKTAEKELVSNYYRGLFFILNRQTKNASLAEDLTQETFIVVIQKARNNEIKHPEKIKTYIRQTGINLLIASVRKEKRRATFTGEDIEIHAPTNDIEISRSLHSNNILSLTTQLIDELKTPRDKEILRQFFIYDKLKDEICNELDLSPVHFDKVLFRARQRLKQLIQHKLNPQEETNNSDTVSRLLMVGILFCLDIPSSSVEPTTIFFYQIVREPQHTYHSQDITLETNSRYLLVFQESKSFTSMRRSV